MSITSSTSEGAAGAVESRPKRTALSSGTTTALVLVALVILYPLSLGPVISWYGPVKFGSVSPDHVVFLTCLSDRKELLAKTKRGPAPQFLGTFYTPVLWLCITVPHLRPAMNSYLKLWDHQLIVNRKATAP